MKLLLTVALMTLALSASANSVVVYVASSSEMNSQSDVVGEFEINRDLGRAWVEVTVYPGDSESLAETRRVKVPGLSYNKVTRQIIFAKDGLQAVCANVKKRIFNTYAIKKTGQCKLTREFYTEEVDNGYEIERMNFFKILLNY